MTRLFVTPMGLSLAMTLILFAPIAQAQPKFPARPIQFVVPYPPGGSNDLFARAIGRKLADGLGQPVAGIQSD